MVMIGSIHFINQRTSLISADNPIRRICAPTVPIFSLGIKTRKGLILTTGCSHPGIEKILETATAVGPSYLTQ